MLILVLCRPDSLVSADLPRLATPVEADLRGSVARERVEALLDHLGALNRLVQGIRGVGRSDDQRRPRVDDGQHVRLCGLSVESDGSIADHPEPNIGNDIVELDIAGEEVAVCPAEEELRAVVGKLEGEGAFLDSSLLDRGREEWILMTSIQIRYDLILILARTFRRLERAGRPIPMRPSMTWLWNSADSRVTAAKVCPVTVTPPTETGFQTRSL